MTTITHVAEAIQTVLTRVADRAARISGFVQRESKLGGAEFTQTLVFGWLANALAEGWPGGGAQPDSAPPAALKISVRLNLSTGALGRPDLQAGRAHDQTAELASAALPPGALRVADLGYFSLASLAAMDAADVYFLSRLRMQTAVYDAAGQPLELEDWLANQSSQSVDVAIELGAAQR